MSALILPRNGTHEPHRAAHDYPRRASNPAALGVISTLIVPSDGQARGVYLDQSWLYVMVEDGVHALLNGVAPSVQPDMDRGGDAPMMAFLCVARQEARRNPP